ncbi:hypothetical protein CDL12_10611 [Handroanthus impetiginosus]|uniref:F-box domain-containing protein n=1 Tax=Handroanthus impetiginosus TaxID=429701 RepID=A0A2G9HGW2_9LAMI|nr:hypothetical protein CDL12_10611 [Handroanthus impetiginosus]
MKRKASHKIPYLPQEIITDILLRLPVKSLLRFKFTSKLWRSLISSKHFVKIHLENSTKNPTFACHRIISVTKEGNKYDIQHCSLHPLFPERVTYASYGDFPVDESVDSLRLLGSCNGLVCISINETKYFLWNPSTRESKKLPDFDLKILSHSHIIEDGFGFEESSGDYKVYAASYDQLQDIAKIYSLKQNSWTRINYNKKDNILSPRTGKFVSGNLHWIRVIEDEWYISSLDLKNGVYGIVERPSYSVKDSWSKMMRICDNLFMDYVLLAPLDIISQNREVLFRCRWDLVVYKSKENSFWYLKKMNGFKNLHHLVYFESLVSVMADVKE